MEIASNLQSLTDPFERFNKTMERSLYQYRVVVLARFFGWIKEINAHVGSLQDSMKILRDEAKISLEVFGCLVASSPKLASSD